jgi:hypothetical protein
LAASVMIFVGATTRRDFCCLNNTVLRRVVAPTQPHD